MGTVACCWRHNCGGGGNSATVDRVGCESYRPEESKIRLGSIGERSIDGHCGRGEIRHSKTAVEQASEHQARTE